MKKLLSAFWILSAGGAFAQSIGPSTLNAAGGSATIGGNTYEWSAAEMTMVSTGTGTNLIVTQGVLQPTTPTTSVKDIRLLSADELKVYPVPTRDILYVMPQLNQRGDMNLALSDATGRMVLHQTIHLATGNEKQELNVAALNAGNYILNVLFKGNNESYQASFKVQKLY
ncbi:MAG: hypothetical protein BGO70_13955 [Bacteroidetes bacterium 43-93]|nr:T9SS type A sorting domain-containing protein [Bacteroidota bacterium]OJW99534.1 MAG: hypothetical protein BGO70_13955 [Bacteroidetes bacterium 43-93]